MEGEAHRHKIKAIVLESLVPFVNFPEVEELKSLLESWSRGEISFLEGQAVVCFDQSRATGSVPLFQSNIDNP